MKKIIVIGATSGIALEVCKIYAKEGNKVMMHGRSIEKMDQVIKRIIKDKSVNRENLVPLPSFDLVAPKKNLDIYEKSDNDKQMLSKWFDYVVSENGLPDIMIVAAGGWNAKLEDLPILNTVAPMRCINNFMRCINEDSFKNGKHSGNFKIAFFNSVASETISINNNYSLYGTSKYMMSQYINELNKSPEIDKDIIFQNIKIGPVDTELLDNVPQFIKIERFVSWLKIKRQIAAKKIVSAINSNREEVYISSFWYYLMFITPMSSKFLSGMTIILALIFVIQTISFGLIVTPIQLPDSMKILGVVALTIITIVGTLRK